jgi:hypothetical protein
VLVPIRIDSRMLIGRKSELSCLDHIPQINDAVHLRLEKVREWKADRE